MKKFVAVFFLLFMCYSTVAAQHLTFGASVGASWPLVDDFSSYWNVGYGVEANVGLVLSQSFALQARVGYNGFQTDQTAILNAVGADGIIFGGSANVSTAFLNTKFTVLEEGTILPYLLFGLGYYRADREEVIIQIGPSEGRRIRGVEESRPGVLLGAGIQTPISRRLALTVEARYIADVGSDQDRMGHFPFTFGIQFM